MIGEAPPRERREWQILGIAVAGRRHLAAGQPCQDAFAQMSFATPAGETLVAALADGAGSVRRAAEGATLAAGIACDLAQAALTRDPPRDGPGWKSLATWLVAETTGRLVRAAVMLGEPGGIAAFGSTLAVAMMRPPWACLISIGDSLAIIACDDGSKHLLDPLVPEHPDGDPTTTVLTSSGVASEIARIAVVEDPAIIGLVLASDGLTTSILEGDEPHRAFIDPLLDHVRSGRDPSEVARYVSADPELIDRSGDDRSLLLAVRR